MLLLGLGSNLSSPLGNRFENIDIAISYLESYKIKLVKKSSFYETPSYPDKTNPKFINVVAQMFTSLPPEDLASVLIFVEEKIGRKRNLNFNVPHEKLVFRNFVLYPLQEILPSWTHPKTKEKVSELIAKLSDEDRKSILKVNKN